MKKLILTFGLAIASLVVMASDTILLNTKITDVTVYLAGGEIIREANLVVTKGPKVIKVTGVSGLLNTSSIQLRTKSDVPVLAINQRLNFRDPIDISDSLLYFKAQLTAETKKIEKLNVVKNAYLEERRLLKALDRIGNGVGMLSSGEVAAAMDVFRKKAGEIDLKVWELGGEIDQHNVKIAEINAEINRLRRQINEPKSTLYFTIHPNSNLNIPIQIRYLVSSCGWAPYYDIRAEDLSSKITFQYRARAFNQTGINWDNVNVKLSSADPLESASKPSLIKWIIRFKEEIYKNKKNVSGYRFNQGEMSYGTSNDNIAVQKNGFWYQEIELSNFSTEFELEKKYSVPSDGKPYLMEVNTYALKAAFSHYTAPIAANGAFIIASVSGWEELDLIEGPANIYFGEKFIGESYIFTNSLDDTLAISLGKDSKIKVSREKVNEKSSKTFIGSNKKESFTYELKVKNNHAYKVKFEIQDQVPMSGSEDIEVEVQNISGANYDTKEGILTWKKDLEPGETVTYLVQFSVKYPKNRNVQISKRKVMSAPKF